MTWTIATLRPRTRTGLLHGDTGERHPLMRGFASLGVVIGRAFMPVAALPPTMASTPLSLLPTLGLLALASVGAFWLGRGEPIVAASAVCVLLIVGSLFVMFSRGPPRAAG